jgi:hypothetical protein
MPGVRIDRLLASTAAILLLAGAASIASAEPKFGTAAETATAPAATGAPSGEINRSAKPAEPSSQEPMAAPAAKPQARADHAVVAIVKPEDIRDSSPASASAPAEEKTEQPAAAPAEAAPAEQPAATAAPSEPAEPAAAEANPAEPATAAAPAEPATTGTTPAPTVTVAPATQPAAAATATGGDEVPAPSPTAPADNAAPATDNAAAPAAAPTPVVADANTPIATQLRELASGKFDRIVGGKKDRPAFDAYYAAHGYAPIWITDGNFNARAAAAIAYLGQVDADGLDPADYPVPNISASVTDPAALAEAEVRLSASVVTYAHHASVGRVHWSRVSSSILYEVKPPVPADVLGAMADAKDVAATAELYRAQSQARRLARGQNHARQGADPEWAATQARRTRRPRAATARAVWAERGRHDLRQGPHRRGEKVPARA